MGVSGYVGREEGRSRRIAVSGRAFANIFLSVVRTFVPALVLIAIAPTVALSAQYGDVVYGPAATGLTTGEYYVQVYAFNRYEAAAAALGNNVRDTSIFTDDVKAKLSNESTGGDFYDFAQKFTDDEYSGGFNPITSSAADLNMQSAYKLNVDMYGRNSVFWAKFTESEAGAASAALARVAAGESGGSGSGDGSGGAIGSFPTSLTLSNGVGRFWSNTNGVRWASEYEPTYSFSSDVVAKIDGVVSQYGFEYTNIFAFAVKDASTSTSINQLYIYLNNEDVTPTATYPAQYNDRSRITYSYTVAKPYVWINVAGNNTTYSQFGSYSVDNAANVAVYYSSGTDNNSESSNGIWGACWYTNTSGGSSGPVIPPTNWPDDGEPVAPSPPELPDPSPPETPNPPQDPTPSPNPTYDVEINYPDFTYVTADLSAILDAMNSHCEHLRHALYDNLTEFWRLLSTKLTNDFATLRSFLSNQFGWQTSAIEGYFDDLSDYLYDLFHWLADQFDFTFGSGDGGYDDRSLLYWLRRIYYKLGTGTTVKPVDPVVEPDAWWKWLEQLFNNFVIDLLALGANGLADVMDGLRTLITKFPFSMPWDIAAILGLLVSEPVTPAVTWPIYSVNSGFQLSQVGTMTIDLDDYSDVWEGVRNMERIAFAVFLAWHITKFTDMMPSKEKAI